MRKFFLVIIFLCLASGLSSAFSPGGGDKNSKKNYLKWESVEGAVSYAIHIRDTDGNFVLNMRTKIAEHYFTLKPGTYRVRIGAVNRFEKVVSWSDWSPLIIKQPVAPVLSSVEPDKLPLSSNLVVVIRGRNFEPGAGIEIKNRNKNIRLEKCRVKDDDLVECRIITGTASEGRYPLVVTNPGGISGSRDITVYRPLPKEKSPGGKIYIQGGYQFIQVIDQWQTPLHHGFYGFFVRGGVPFSRIFLLKEWAMREYFFFEGALSYSYFSSRSRDGIVDSALHQLIPGIYLAASLPLYRSRLYLQIRAGGGFAWHTLVRDWTFGSTETSYSTDGMMGAGAAFSYRWIPFTVFAGCDYQLIFTGINLNHSLIYRVGIGYMF